jgi:PST family polysaccharide transporter
MTTSGTAKHRRARGSSSTVTGSTRSALLWSYLLTGGRFITTGVVTLVIAAFVEPGQYGVMVLATIWVVFAQSLAMHGPGLAVIQRPEVDDRHYDAAFWSTVVGSTILAAIFAAVAPLWASVNGTHELVYVCWALTPAIVLNALVVVPDAILRRHLQFKNLSLRILLAGLASGVVGISVAIAGGGVWALVLQQITQTTFSAVAVWFAVSWRPKLSAGGSALRDLRSYSLHSVSGAVSYFVATRTDALLLGAVFGPVAIGLYRFANRITDMVTDIAVGGLGAVSLPDLSRYSLDHKAFAARVGKMIHAATLTSFPVFGILAASAPWLVRWIGPQWTDAGTALRVLCLSGAFGAIGSVFAASFQAVGKPSIAAWLGWLMAGLAAGSMWSVGRAFSSGSTHTQVLAVAYAFLGVNAIIVVLSAILLFRVVLRTSAIRVFRPSLPAAIASLAAVGVGVIAEPLLSGAPPFVGLVVTGTIASVVGGAILMLVEREITTRVRRAIARRRHRPETDAQPREHLATVPASVMGQDVG